jgi:hypothetical protein
MNLDIFWLRDKSLEDSDDLPPPDVLAQEIADDLQAALEQFTAIAESEGLTVNAVGSQKSIDVVAPSVAAGATGIARREAI